MQELAAEQRHVDVVYERLEGLREQTKALAAEGHSRATGGPLTGLVERDALVHRASAQLAAIDAEAEGLVFGRLDFDDGETYHIGRLGLRDDDHEPLLVDWRAPAAEPFYRATSGQPLGVVRRRVIICRGPRVIDLDDDVLVPDAVDDLAVLGEGALLAALRRSRGGHMRDIVTTIQREQDEAIRAPARGVTLITGGPGTGKTQVALHRAAYLLYSDHGRFADGRILVVGPSTVFTSYISRVLPALGEESVHLRSLGELVAGVRATRRDNADVARIKGDERMVDVLTDWAWHTPPAAPDRFRILHDGQIHTLGRAELDEVRLRVRARAETLGTKPNAARSLAVAALLERLGSTVDEIGERPEFERFVRAWWPALTPTGVLAAQQGGSDWTVDDVPLLDELTELLGEVPAAPKAPAPEWQLRELTSELREVETFVLSCGLRDGWELYAPGHPIPIAVAGPAIDNDAVTAAQRFASAVILREGYRVVGWVDGFDPHGEEGYVPVLDQRTPMPTREPEDSTPVEDRYLHVILDEAQDLSPMECRMIARRAEFASMTVVGDLGQATHPLAPADWPLLLARLGKREVRTLELHTGYRVPEVIANYANRILAPGLTPTRSYRPGGTLTVRQVADLPGAVRDAVREAPAGASVAVIAADAAEVLTVDGVSADVVAGDDFAAVGVTGVPAGLVKGLEFDHVIVVEPADIVAAEPRGMNRLYVVLTRAVSSLVVLHQKPLPRELREKAMLRNL
jgi:hypothetical protein